MKCSRLKLPLFGLVPAILVSVFLTLERRPAQQAAARSAAHPAASPEFRLTKLRSGFRSDLKDPPHPPRRIEAPTPPPGIFAKVMYAAPLGQNVAYVSPVRVGPKRPAIVWISGGFDWGLDSSPWEDAPAANDQTARAFRDAGIVLMLPSLRGTNRNPGRPEYFLGEVDDIVAAAESLARRPDVDPQRIYLGGHSTGATLALLVAESTARFRAAFAFGPVDDVSSYGSNWAPFDMARSDERILRSPGYFMSTIVTPTFVIEGSGGNIGVFSWLRRASHRAPVHFVPVLGADHFNVLAPMSELIAKKILADTGDSFSMAFYEDEIDELVLTKLSAG